MTTGMESMVAAVTGAAGAAGAATARRLAAQGVRLVLGGVRLTPLHALACEINEAGGQARFFALDAARLQSLQGFVADAQAAFGRLDLVVHCEPTVPLSALALPAGLRAVLPHALGGTGIDEVRDEALPVPALPPPCRCGDARAAGTTH